jgi:hypothetical protein
LPIGFRDLRAPGRAMKTPAQGGEAWAGAFELGCYRATPVARRQPLAVLGA